MSEAGREVLRQHALKLSESNRGKPCSESRRENIRISRLGHDVSEDTREKIRTAMSGENNPNYGKQRSEETKAKIRAAKLGNKHTEETKAIIKAKRALQGCSEETRRKMSEARKGIKNPNYGKPLSKERRKHLSEINTGENHPMFGKVGAMKGKHHSEETKEKMRATQLIVQNLPEVKQHKSEMSSGERNHNWNGGPKEYCPKFNADLKRRVRAFFNYTCPLCGKPETCEEHLSVHHVYANKQSCCDVSESGERFTDLGIIGRKKDFKIVGDPNKFVPLHRKCHSLITPLNKRDYYTRLFESIINEKHNGRCYCTKEEYDAMFSSRCYTCKWIETCIDPCNDCKMMMNGIDCKCEQGDNKCRSIVGPDCKDYEQLAKQ